MVTDGLMSDWWVTTDERLMSNWWATDEQRILGFGHGRTDGSTDGQRWLLSRYRDWKANASLQNELGRSISYVVFDKFDHNLLIFLVFDILIDCR